MNEQNTNPRLFIVGAPKCATSTLHDWLGQHPDVFASGIKETHFFTHKDVLKTYYVPAQIVTTEAEYAEVFEDAKPGQWLLDSTPNYLLYPHVAGEIRKRYPKAKVIAILRHPVDRAISHFKMDRVLGIHSEPVSRLLDLTREDVRYEREYLGNSRYATALRPYQELFGAEQLLILDFDRFRTEPEALLEEVYSFIGIDTAPAKFTDLTPKNQFSAAGHGYHRFLRGLPFLYPLVRSLPEGMKDGLKKLTARKKVAVDEGDTEAVIKAINAALLADIEALKDMIPWTSKFGDAK